VVAAGIRVLVVEDVEDHALLIVRELHKGGMVPVFRRVETREELQDALDSEQWDAVISDFRLPGFTGLEALRTIRESGLDVPFILVSGAIGEEQAVAAMKAGVHDYIIKGHYERLVPALERELREAETRRERIQAEEMLRRETEERLRIMEELREKDQMLIQQSHFAAMGELISNIAHHWRQPLNVLALIVQDMTIKYRRGTFTAEFFETNASRAMEVINHLSGTIDSFGYFFRSGEKRVFKAKEVLEKAVTLVAGSMEAYGSNLQVKMEGDVTVEGAERDLFQVLLNILMNARDACVERGIAKPVLSVRMFRREQKSIIAVGDNAGGIPGEIMDRIFDPYFTTKRTSYGSGIGLYMARIIVEKNLKGRLSVRNTGDGAEFTIEM
jgi:C4-dicarboxylate-specific signal transduction histidine kinase